MGGKNCGYESFPKCVNRTPDGAVYVALPEFPPPEPQGFPTDSKSQNVVLFNVRRAMIEPFLFLKFFFRIFLHEKMGRKSPCKRVKIYYVRANAKQRKDG